jgi:hypothetical protein
VGDSPTQFGQFTVSLSRLLTVSLSHSPAVWVMPLGRSLTVFLSLSLARSVSLSHSFSLAHSLPLTLSLSRSPETSPKAAYLRRKLPLRPVPDAQIRSEREKKKKKRSLQEFAGFQPDFVAIRQGIVGITVD